VGWGSKVGASRKTVTVSNERPSDGVSNNNPSRNSGIGEERSTGDQGMTFLNLCKGERWGVIKKPGDEVD